MILLDRESKHQNEVNQIETEVKYMERLNPFPERWVDIRE